MKRIYFTVTNDLTFDQRMIRICTSLSTDGYEVTLVGRQLKSSIPLDQKSFFQKRLNCLFNTGPLFYIEYNMQLFFFLLFRKMDAVCAIDLDTILPCLFISSIKNIPRIYDAHEFFTEMVEVRKRPLIRKAWLFIEKWAVPKFKFGYTVSEGLAKEFKDRYQRNYIVIRNLPVLENFIRKRSDPPFILAQGAVNEGRAFEYLIPAMKQVPYLLTVCGDGNFMPQLKELIHKNNLKSKIELKGMLPPNELKSITQSATLGMAIAEGNGAHQFLALPNKFFDYIHACIPQIAMAYPEYININKVFKVAVLIDALDENTVAQTIMKTINDQALLSELEANCAKAREVYCWQSEEKILTAYYKMIFEI